MVIRFERDQLSSTAWKNGGGRTREIARMPAGSGMDTFDWRASIANISADGPFSTFAGFDRVIVLLSGKGVHLRSSDGSIDHRLDQPLVPFAFAGESAIVASLIGDASSDFNIMTRRTAVRSDMQVVRASQTLASCSAGVLFSAKGTWDVRAIGATSPITLALPASSGVWWDGESLGWDLTLHDAGAALIAGCIVDVRSRDAAP